jgi:hypothetical protein
VTIPFLGDLANQKAQAAAHNNGQGGRIWNAKTLTWDATNGYRAVDFDLLNNRGPGGNGGPGVYDGTLVLLPDSNGRIRIDGPIVVTGDVIIRGQIEGQGTIYAGRNIHIVGDLTYQQPPRFGQGAPGGNQPLPDPAQEVRNQIQDNRDFLGLIASGSVIVGDYTDATWRSVYVNSGAPLNLDMSGQGQYQEIDQAAPTLGYDNAAPSNCGGQPCFNRNYKTTWGTKTNLQTGATTARALYESSIDDASFRQAVTIGTNPVNTGNPATIHAAIYTNHIVTGIAANNLTVLGALIAREETIGILGALNSYNYDMRLWYTGSLFNVNLPLTEQPPVVISYKIKK